MVRSDIVRALALIAVIGFFVLTLAVINRPAEPHPMPVAAGLSSPASAADAPSSRASGSLALSGSAVVLQGGAR